MGALSAILIFVSLIMFFLFLTRLIKPQGIDGKLQGKTRKDALLKLFIPSVFIFLVAGAVAPQQQNEKNISKTNKKQQEKSLDNTSKDHVLPFEYMSVEADRDVKYSVDVRIKGWGTENIPNKKQLKATARHVASLKSAENSFVRIFLPGMEESSGGYALFTTREGEDEELNVWSSNLPAKYRGEKPKDKSPTQFESIEKMARKFISYRMVVLRGGDHPRLRVEMKEVENALEIQPDVVREDVARGLVYGAYKTFIHTDANAVEVVSLPFVGQGENKKYVDRFKKNIDVTRKKALKAARNVVGVESFSDLVGDWYGGAFHKDSPSSSFSKIKFDKREQILSLLTR